MPTACEPCPGNRKAILFDIARIILSRETRQICDGCRANAERDTEPIP